MKRLFLAACAIAMLAGAEAQQQQLKIPPPSPTQTVRQDFGLSTVELSYSRPSMKGRKVFGDLVPYKKVWRTGANNATTLNFGEEVIIGGKKIPAGKYGLLTIPDNDSWTIIITKQLDVTQPAAYKEENDVVRVNVKPMLMKDKTETFTMQFEDIKAGSCNLNICWENTAVKLPISTDADAKVMADINNMMNNDTRNYYNAALYYLQNGKDLNQALAWFDKAAEANPTAFWIHHNRANCLAKLGRKKEAKDAAEKSKELAIAAKNDDYVKLNNDLLANL